MLSKRDSDMSSEKVKRVKTLQNSSHVNEDNAKSASCNDKSYKYDIAISFAGEQRKEVEEIVNALKERNVRVFYDMLEKASLWGKNLYQHLQKVYRDEARYCVVCISKEYAQKLWTNHELKQAQARAFTESREYILPLRFDDTEIPGITTTTGYIDHRTIEFDDLIDIIVEKINLTAPQEEREKTSATPSKNTNGEIKKKLVLTPYSESRKESVFLDYRYSKLLFCGRKNELNYLDSFREQDNYFSWLLVYGDAGSGKSRLAWEYLRQLQEQGIKAGFADSSSLGECPSKR